MSAAAAAKTKTEHFDVMIVGAGPGLGATLARRCAEDGADLVLAAA